MLIWMNGAQAESKSASRRGGSYLDVADDLLGADWYCVTSVLSNSRCTSSLSPTLPEDFSGFDLDAFLDRVSTLATLV